MTHNLFPLFAHLLDRAIASSPTFRTFMRSPYGNADPFHFKDMEVVFGATRGVIVPTDASIPWVAKFDVEGDEVEEGLCEREATMFAAAEQCGVANYFAPMHYLGTYRTVGLDLPYDVAQDFVEEYGDEGYEEMAEFQHKEEFVISISLYGMEYAEEIGAWSFETDPQLYTYIERNPSPISDKYEEIGEEFVRLYGEEEYERLAQFCCEKGINDIHYGNIGYVGDRLVLIDYAGYYCR